MKLSVHSYKTMRDDFQAAQESYCKNRSMLVDEFLSLGPSVMGPLTFSILSFAPDLKMSLLAIPLACGAALVAHIMNNRAYRRAEDLLTTRILDNLNALAEHLCDGKPPMVDDRWALINQKIMLQDKLARLPRQAPVLRQNRVIDTATGVGIGTLTGFAIASHSFDVTVPLAMGLNYACAKLPPFYRSSLNKKLIKETQAYQRDRNEIAADLKKYRECARFYAQRKKRQRIDALPA